MNDEEKRAYLEDYQARKAKGRPFFPDILFKDAVVSLLVLLVLVALAYFVGAPLEARANPNDTTYTPRPEWYFLFLFQLLKYFPGKLEIVGVFLLPTAVVLLLFVLPFLDRSPRRHPLARPFVSGLALLAVVGVLTLTVLAVREAPPPQAASAGGDPTAALYAQNCAACHGASIDVPAGTNLTEIIAQGGHAGMPAWSGDLTADQIDALAGFILSPVGSQIFTRECSACHDAPGQLAADPQRLSDSLAQGTAFAPHAGLKIPNWPETLTAQERTALLNFLAAPDGQRLFALYCGACHGQSVSFSGDRSALHDLISRGGLHLTMPPWRERLTDAEILTLAAYVVDPKAAPNGATLFRQNCAQCHGSRVPAASGPAQARDIISSGGPHATMPVWGNILTAQQIDALTDYTLSASAGTPVEVGSDLFAKNCAACHGPFGEGGPNPARPGDIIAPISSAEFLQTRDDATLRSIISQGQPSFGMSPFGEAYGGPLTADQVDALVAFLRSWQENPPVTLPPEVAAPVSAVTGQQIYAQVCAQCHGPAGEGGIGPSLVDPAFQSSKADQQIFDAINLGHPATPMIGWGEILSDGQIQQLVAYIRQLGSAAAPTPTLGAPTATPGGPSPTPGAGASPTPAAPSFSAEVLPLLQTSCSACHGSMGGWDASTYNSVVNSGANGPAVMPGDTPNSLLAQKLLGTQTIGGPMPPGASLPKDKIQIILDWIAGGAPNN
jgi:mono/diheme cytochrome c family protein